MAAYADKAPWSEGYRRTSKKRTHEAGYSWDLSGYGKSREGVSRTHDVKRREVTLHNGRKVIVDEGDPDYRDYMTFRGTNEAETRGDAEMVAYIEKAFARADNPDLTKGVKVTSAAGCGHIALLEYSAFYTMLRVTFANNGSVVVYFRVPTAVFGELYYLAQSRTQTYASSDGKLRHALGIRFWDLIRIRGNLHGSRYKFAYTTQHGGGVTGHGGRPQKRYVSSPGVYKTDLDDLSLKPESMQTSADKEKAAADKAERKKKKKKLNDNAWDLDRITGFFEDKWTFRTLPPELRKLYAAYKDPNNTSVFEEDLFNALRDSKVRYGDGTLVISKKDYFYDPMDDPNLFGDD